MKLLKCHLLNITLNIKFLAIQLLRKAHRQRKRPCDCQLFQSTVDYFYVRAITFFLKSFVFFSSDVRSLGMMMSFNCNLLTTPD